MATPPPLVVHISIGRLSVRHDTPAGPYWASAPVIVAPSWATRLVEDVAECLDRYVESQIGFIDPNREWFVGNLGEPAEPVDETGGMTLEELIPETVGEWKRIREEATS